MGNICAFRSTDPKRLFHVTDPVGPANQEHLARLVKTADLVVAAWGRAKFGVYPRGIADWILSLPQTRTLGVNQDGTPKHPLYLPKTTELQSAEGPR